MVIAPVAHAQNLYVATSGDIQRVGPGGGVATTFATGFLSGGIRGIAFDHSLAPSTAPEPSTLALLALGVLPVAGLTTRRRRKV
ncbi:PEP-CTERM sorting domain-containing protein [Armatimonas sp.]|uniref:PEP-CTERM sorting domain-containing protein n=1 Tax=Armatimonas sp. TaxID=1872638 RepID=UPI003751CF62